MEAGLDSIQGWLRVQTGGSAGAHGGAASGRGRFQPFSCSLGRLPSGAAAAGSGATVSGAGGSACGGACGSAGGSAGRGGGAASGGGRLQPFSCSLGQLPTGAAAADSSGSCSGARGGATGGAGRFAGGGVGGYGGVTLGLTTGVFEVALLDSCGSFPLLDVVPLFTLPGGGMVLALAGVGGTLAGLTVAPFEPLIASGTTADVDLVAEVLGWVLATQAGGEGRGGRLRWIPVLLTQEGVPDHRCMLHNLALRHQVPFLQEDEPGDGLVAVVEPVDSEEEE
ncbi:hypothetical protein NDU88_001498 [Pleurodeles waltl]|uniref:Uncharacterized protein n=1 Tax=Pleurodeles waltl TaxID=8319 RepID=A0AAV7THU6_PLEWA|nr:hypothetical protein NDU88_001498 [Pleurodeles waltl]